MLPWSASVVPSTSGPPDARPWRWLRRRPARHLADAVSRRPTSTVSPASAPATPASARQVAHAIGVDDLGWCADVLGGGNIVTSTVAGAAAAVLSGQADVVVVYRVLGSEHPLRQGIRTRPGGRRAASSPGPTATSCRRSGSPCGPGATSTCTARPREDLGAIAVQQRAHALNNPHAIAHDADHASTTTSTAVGSTSRSGSSTAATRSTAPWRSSSPRPSVPPTCAHPPVYLLGVGRRATGSAASVDQWDDMTCMYSRDTAPTPVEPTGLDAVGHGRGVHVRLLHLHRDGHDRGLRLLREGRGRRLLPRGPRHLRR